MWVVTLRRFQALASDQWPYLAHVPVVLLLFSGVLFQDLMPFFRDLLGQYYPDYVFLSRSVGQGVLWPLWNPLVHAGSSFLVPYPVDYLSVLLWGPLDALRLDAPGHVLLAMCGASLLGRLRGLESPGVWVTGLIYGLSGYLLSSASLMQLLHAAAWAPWVIAAALRVLRVPDARGCALLGLVLALQVSTVAVDMVLQTALACLFLLPKWPSLRHVRAYVAASLLAALLAAPVLVGTSWRLQGTRRAAGFDAEEALSFSASPLVLLESFVPHLFGDVRTFSDRGYWGKPFFEGQLPYFMSLYLGPGVLLLASLAGFRRGAAALWTLALVGLLMSLGANGPFASAQLVFLQYFRFPIKFFFLANLALCLLAGHGIDRCTREQRRLSGLRFAPALIFLASAGVVSRWPDLPSQLLASLVPELSSPAAKSVVRTSWPGDLFRTGALCLAAAFALQLEARKRSLAAVVVAMDMMAANVVLNPAARRDFYDLLPPLRALVDRAVAEGHFRWFALSLNASRDVRFWDRLAISDVVAYRAARQSMLGTSNVLDGLESAQETEGSYSPRDSFLPYQVRTVERFREYFPEVRLANVRWVLSLKDLPPDLVRLVSQVAIQGLVEPLRFYEVLDPVERAFWTPRCAVVPETEIWFHTRRPGFEVERSVLLDAPPAGVSCDREAPSGPASVAFEQPDPHTVRLRVRSPPGFVVVVQRFHADWKAEGSQGPVPLLRAYARFWALPTPGGEQTFVVRFRPRWPAPALALSVLGLAVVGLALVRRWPASLAAVAGLASRAGAIDG